MLRRLGWLSLVLLWLMLDGCSSKIPCEFDLDCPDGFHCGKLSEQCIQACVHNFDCPREQLCNRDRGRCEDKTSCTPRHKQACQGGHLFWFDSCDYQQEKAQDCGTSGCTDQSCNTGNNNNNNNGGCPDGTCGQGENCGTCPADCPCAAGLSCKQNQCTKDNNPPQNCPNGTCESNLGENCATCAQDCGCPQGQSCEGGACKASVACGDKVCQPSENCSTCPKDCGCPLGQSCQNNTCQAACGDGTCDPKEGEYCDTCPKDCGCKTAERCVNSTCEACPCAPGQKRCQNDQLQQCNTACTDWENLELCSQSENRYCDPNSGSCKCKGDACTQIGAYRCLDSTKRELCVQGKHCVYWQPVDCPPQTPICSKGKCCVCQPGSTRCAGLTGVETCKSDCSGWTKSSCPSATPLCCSNSCKKFC